MSTSRKKNVTAALTWSKIRKTWHEYRSRKQNYGGATGEKFRKTWRVQVWKTTSQPRYQWTNAHETLQRMRMTGQRVHKPLPCRILCQIPLQKAELPFATSTCLPLVACVLVVFLQPHCSWEFLFASGITFQDCIAERPTRCVPAGRHFLINHDQLGRHLQWRTMAGRMQIQSCAWEYNEIY